MQVVFLSSTIFGSRCLTEAILRTPGVQVAGILTTPRWISFAAGRKPMEISTFADFRLLADTVGCQVVTTDGHATTESIREILSTWRPDLVLALGWYFVVPRSVRETIPLGCVGIHASLLPQYRGGAPIPWAIIRGETRTGVTLFYLEDRIDCGDVIAQAAFSIREEDTCATLYEKATRTSVALLHQYLPRIANRTAPRIPQDERQASCYPQRTPEDGRLDWTRLSTQQAYNWIRALTRPYPGAFTYYGREKVTLWKASLSSVKGEAPPGAIMASLSDVPEAFGVWCADGRLLRIHEIGLVHGVVMKGADFIATRGIQTGAVLSEVCLT